MIVFFTRNKHLLSQSTRSMLRADFSKSLFGSKPQICAEIQ